jgi:hypothetical protein
MGYRVFIPRCNGIMRKERIAPKFPRPLLILEQGQGKRLPCLGIVTEGLEHLGSCRMIQFAIDDSLQV